MHDYSDNLNVLCIGAMQIKCNEWKRCSETKWKRTDRSNATVINDDKNKVKEVGNKGLQSKKDGIQRGKTE